LLNEYFSKVFSKNEKWTFLKMSKNENPKKLLGKICKKTSCDENALGAKKII
jgi:hypothetical protein